VRRGRERHFGAAFQRMAESIAPTDPLTRVTVVWPSVVGEAIAKHTRPTAIKGNELLVECDSSVYSQEIELLSRKVLKGISDGTEGPSPTSLRCVLRNSR
jgi:predicted nucleic acid-binding Zn ribbon protein